MRLSEQEGRRLREEATYPGVDGREAVSWGEAVDRWRSWYDDQRGTQVVVENGDGDRTGFSTPNRYTPEYREMQYAKAKSLERGLRERWGRLLHTAMITLTASSTDACGRPRPPADHLEELLSSWEAVRRALSRVLDGREWEYLAILEPHESGYVHVHIGVFVAGPVVAEQFEPVIDAHLRNCPSARAEAHEIIDDEGEEDTVSVHRSAGRDGGIDNLGAYLAAYLAGEYGAEATEMPDFVQAFYATMWSTGKQWFRPSNGAQEHMQPDEDDDEEEATDWRLIGILPDGGDPDDDDEVVEVDPEQDRGSVYCRLGPPPD